MIRLSSSLLSAALLLAPAAAHADERLVSRVYDASDVVRINGRLGVQATIGFGEKEAIENVAVGDAESWQITPNKRADLLFVKPLSANARTNMTVVTDKHTYFFDLVASPKANPVYMLRFSYKDEPKTAPAAGVVLTDAERQVLTGDLAAAPTDPALLNFSWARKGDADLLPARVYDDGDSTYLLWGAKQQLPAILVTNEKGQEGPVNYAVRGSTIVIDEVPGRILLRIGKKLATLQNQRPAATPLPSPAPAPAPAPVEAVPARAMPASAPVAAVAATDPSKR
jgi:type IV secretion system protein VirB9